MLPCAGTTLINMEIKIEDAFVTIQLLNAIPLIHEEETIADSIDLANVQNGCNYYILTSMN